MLTQGLKLNCDGSVLQAFTLGYISEKLNVINNYYIGTKNLVRQMEYLNTYILIYLYVKHKAIFKEISMNDLILYP